MAPVIHVSIYRGARAPQPIAQDAFPTWAALADELSLMVAELPDCADTEDGEEQKKHMLAFAPHRLSPVCKFGKACGMCHGGAHRLLANVEAVTLMVLDVDKCADVEVLVSRVRSATPEAGLVYESPSSRPDAARVRIVAPVSREFSVDECYAARYAFAEACGLEPLQGVEGAIDAAKLFFIGRLHGTPERKVWRW
jgi:hypothetical protein